MVKGLAIKRCIYCSLVTVLGVGFAYALAKLLSTGSGDPTCIVIGILGVIGCGSVVFRVVKGGQYA